MEMFGKKGHNLGTLMRESFGQNIFNLIDSTEIEGAQSHWKIFYYAKCDPLDGRQKIYLAKPKNSGESGKKRFNLNLHFFDGKALVNC
jgi:hypothetical protein